MTRLNSSHLSQTCCLGRSPQSKPLTKEESLPVTSEEVWIFSVCLCVSLLSLCLPSSLSLIAASHLHSFPLCDIMCTHTHIHIAYTTTTNKQHLVCGGTHCIRPCDPLNCVDEGLRNNCLCHRSSQLCGVWRPQIATSPQAKLAFPLAAGSGIRQAVCAWEGCVHAAASRFVLGVHHHIAAHSSSVILITIVWCLACCVIWVQRELWESKESERAKLGKFSSRSYMFFVILLAIIKE